MRDAAWWRRLGRLVKRKAVEWWEPEPFLVNIWDGVRANWRQAIGASGVFALLEWLVRGGQIDPEARAIYWVTFGSSLAAVGQVEASEIEDDDRATRRPLPSLRAGVLLAATYGVITAVLVLHYGGRPALAAAMAGVAVTLGAVRVCEVRAKARRNLAES